MLDLIRKNNPKQFFKYFSKQKAKVSQSDLKIDDFYTHFKNLNNKEFDNAYISSNGEPIFEELDMQISTDEVLAAIQNLKRGKSCSEDNILNEVFIDCSNELLLRITNVFNNIFKSGFFPESWTKGCVVPIYKKGDINDPNNYRGLTLVSCMGKLFTSILNKRLMKWDQKYNVITDAQFGFKPGCSTIDAIFVLQTMINKTLKSKKRLYCCFIDYKKAFDLIDRSILWTKLINQGIDENMLKIIQSLYQNVKSCIKYNGFLSEYYRNTIGLFQGEILSPILYSLYVNDCEMCFIRENCPSVEIGLINLFLIMYADDTVLLAESPKSLQEMIDTLYKHNNDCKLTLNVDKTKIMIFRNGGRQRENEYWTYNNVNIDVVDEFNYLGMLFNYNGKFKKTQIHVANQGRKAYFSICSKLKNHAFNISTQCSIFDTYINSILGYASEIWGHHKAPEVEKVHTNFCKKCSWSK